jgi:hypothetical protein
MGDKMWCRLVGTIYTTWVNEYLSITTNNKDHKEKRHDIANHLLFGSRKLVATMSCPILTVLRSDESLQELIRGVEDAVTLSLMVLAAWRLGRAIAVKIIEGILSERALKTHIPLN